MEALDDEYVKMLNLAHDLLHSFLPFVLGKVSAGPVAGCGLLADWPARAQINRVSFGLLSDEDIARALQRDPKMPKSRKLTSVPFVGKDVPSGPPLRCRPRAPRVTPRHAESSEFAHPDVVIGLTILAYRYEGTLA
jgi:hypothetical protein